MAVLAVGARRQRYLTLFLFLAVLTLIYITTAPSTTYNSAFYRKTIAALNAKSNTQISASVLDAAAEGVEGAGGQGGSGSGQGGEGESPVFDKEALKERLQAAANAAKKSADDKWTELKDSPAVKSAVAEAKKAAASVADATSSSPSTQETQDTQRPSHDHSAHDHAHSEPPAEPSSEDITTELQTLLSRSPLVIFSKSYCPYSRKAKKILLDEMDIQPAPTVVELDQHAMGPQLQALLRERTGRGTVPNVMVAGRSLGGGDDVEGMLRDGVLGEKILGMSGRKITKAVKRDS